MWSRMSLTKDPDPRDESKARLSGGARVQEGPMLVGLYSLGMSWVPSLVSLGAFCINLSSLSRGHLYFANAAASFPPLFWFSIPACFLIFSLL